MWPIRVNTSNYNLRSPSVKKSIDFKDLYFFKYCFTICHFFSFFLIHFLLFSQISFYLYTQVQRNLRANKKKHISGEFLPQS